METKNRKTVILICAGAFIGAFLIGVVLSLIFAADSGSNIGLRNSGAEQTDNNISLSCRDEEYRSREELPVTTADSLSSVIMGQLSAGNFTELDAQLKNLAETYKDNSDQSEDESLVIDNYRADIAYYLSGLNNDPLDAWYFYNPETLAAAVAYSPISAKYKAFINRDSAILPMAQENILLQRVNLTSEQYKELLNIINRQRTDAGKFQSVAVFDMKILGYSCRLAEVRDMQTYCYQPYALYVDDLDYDIRADFIDQIVLQNPDANLDDIFAAPKSIE